MNLDIDFLKTFIAVADTKGFTSAGQLICRSQSAVSMQIKRLESEVNKKLFVRSGHTVHLTAEGHLLLKFARRIVEAHDDATSAISRTPMMDSIRFGAPEYFTSGILLDLLKEFSSAYPNVLIDLRCEESEKIKSAIEKKELDIGLCSQCHGEGQIVFSDPVVWISKPGLKVREKKRLHLAVFRETCVLRSWALAALDRAGMDFRIAYVCQNVAAILDTVRTGMAVAPVVRSIVPSDLAIVGVESGLPVLPDSNVSLLISKSQSSDGITSFSEILIKSFAQKCKRELRL